MFTVIKNNVIIKNLVPQHKQFINILLNDKIKFDFTSITIVDSCNKMSSNFVNNKIFPNIDSIYLFSPNYTKTSYNKLLNFFAEIALLGSSAKNTSSLRFVCLIDKIYM